MTTNNMSLDALFQEFRFRTTLATLPESSRSALAEFLAKEYSARQTYRIQRLLASCGIPKAQIRTFDDFDWNFNSKIPKQDILNFRNSAWIEEHMNLVLIGDPGIGKSHLAKALCYDAIIRGHSTYFITAFDLVSKIKKARFLDSNPLFYG